MTSGWVVLRMRTSMPRPQTQVQPASTCMRTVQSRRPWLEMLQDAIELLDFSQTKSTPHIYDQLDFSGTSSRHHLNFISTSSQLYFKIYSISPHLHHNENYFQSQLNGDLSSQQPQGKSLANNEKLKCPEQKSETEFYIT